VHGGEQPLPSNESQYIDFSQVQEAVPPQPSQEQAELPNPLAVPQPTPTGAFASEAYAQLSELGIDLPVSPDAIAPEFADAYNLMAQKVLDTFQAATQQTMEAQIAQQRIQDLSQRLSTPEGQERLILSLALSNPDNFRATMETVQRMQTDPEYADTQRMRLEAEARYEQAQRMEQAYKTTQMQTKGQQVEGRVERIARQRGIDVDIAKQMVVSKILQNEATTGMRDISFAEVDDVLARLAKRPVSILIHRVASQVRDVRAAPVVDYVRVVVLDEAVGGEYGIADGSAVHVQPE